MGSDNRDTFRPLSRRRFLRAASTTVGALALAACGQAGSEAGGTGQAGTSTAPAASGAQGAATGAVKWSTWGNPGEITRFQEYTADFVSRNPGITSELVPLPSDYEAKMLTQLAGGTAPDVFYSNESFVTRLAANNSIIELTELLNGPQSISKPDEFFEGLWGAGRTEDGKIYGPPVDCNPLGMWLNKKVLADSGVTDAPVELAKAGTWNWDAFSGIVEQVVATGKRGLILENWWGGTYNWATTNGGKIYDKGRFVANEDPKSVEGYQFIYDNLQNKNFVYAGSLPRGQGSDAMFLSQQVAFITGGRWLLPVFKKASGLEYDFVTWPTNTGNKIEPTGVGTSYLVINAQSKNQEAAFAFLTDFVSKQGQVFRLNGGGNALPSIRGADEVVSEDNLPANWQAFLDAREIGWAVFPTQTRVAGLAQDIDSAFDALWLKGGDVKATLDKVGEMVNAKLEAA